MDSTDVERFFPHGSRDSTEKQYIKQEKEQHRKVEEHEVCMPISAKLTLYPLIGLLAITNIRCCEKRMHIVRHKRSLLLDYGNSIPLAVNNFGIGMLLLYN